MPTKRDRRRFKLARRPTNDGEVIFSDEDSDLRAVRWRLDHHGYARCTRGINGKTKSLYAHRIVLGRMLNRPPLASEICDHLNHVPLDNRRENLRAVNAQQNAQNRKCSRFRGTRALSGGRGVVRLRINNQDWNGGVYETRELAAQVAKSWRLYLGFHGETA